MSQMFLNIVSTFKSDGLSAATRQLGAFGKATNGLGATLGKVGAALASFGVITKTVQFTQQTIDSARDLERNLFSVNTIFGDLAPRMVQFTENAEKIGLSQKDAAKSVTFLGSVLKQSGFSMEDTADETEKLVGLAVDLAATYGYDVSEALLGMTALFRGEYDPIEKFGVAMKQNEINSELAARGQDKLQGAARRNAEQIIRMELLYQRASDATGAFAAQSGNLFVEQKKLSAQFENMKAAIGTALLPAVGDLVASLKPLVDQLTPLLIDAARNASPALKTLTGFLKDMADDSTTTGATVKFLTDILGALFKFVSENFGVLVQLTILIGGVRLAIILLNAALTTSAFGWAIIGIGALTGAFILLNEQLSITDGLLGNTTKKINNVIIEMTQLYRQGAGWNEIRTKVEALNFSAKDTSIIMQGIQMGIRRINNEPMNTIIENIRDFRDGWNEAAAAKEWYNSGKITTPPVLAPVVDTPAGAGGGKTQGSTGGLKEWIANTKKEVKLAAKEQELLALNFSQGFVDSLLSGQAPLKTANQLITRIDKKGDQVIANQQNRFNKTAAGLAEIARIEADNRAKADQLRKEREAADKATWEAEQARIAERQRIYKSFQDSVQSIFGQIQNAILGAFDLPQLGGSTNSIIRNMNKLLERTKSFATSVSKLASMGLDPMLLQQIISSGPIAGARLANALVMGGAGALGAINAGYAGFSSLAAEIASTGTLSRFGTESQATIYNINVDGGVGSGATIGKAIVDAIKAYERTSGAVWQGA